MGRRFHRWLRITAGVIFTGLCALLALVVGGAVVRPAYIRGVISRSLVDSGLRFDSERRQPGEAGL